jgi:hypothetical protein
MSLSPCVSPLEFLLDGLHQVQGKAVFLGKSMVGAQHQDQDEITKISPCALTGLMPINRAPRAYNQSEGRQVRPQGPWRD